ncbi:MAG: DUF234 domain-containing protein [Candidatus Bipolaricaulia bacterium]
MLPNVSLIESGRSKLVYDRFIHPYLNDYMGPVFEEICREYVHHFWDECLETAPRRVGAHWARDFDIDVVTENVDGGHLVGECKWTSRPVGERVLDKLMANAQQLPRRFQQDVRYVIFSLSGFTDNLVKRAQSLEERVSLITAAEMVEG